MSFEMLFKKKNETKPKKKKKKTSFCFLMPILATSEDSLYTMYSITLSMYCPCHFQFHLHVEGMRKCVLVTLKIVIQV